MIELRSRAEIEKMREAGRIVSHILRTVGAMAQPGVTTGELEDAASQMIGEHGGMSPFLGYTPMGHPPFPAYTCVSVNEEIVHGVPGPRKLRDGDIVTIDCGVELDGWIADSAWTYGVGKISPQTERLLKVTKESLYRGIAQARAGNRVGDIGNAVQKYVEAQGFSVVRELTGHGVGRELHEDLQIPHYGSRGKGVVLQTGMTFAIEPMINAGRKDIKYQEDRWTISTADKKLSAHFEHTVAITPDGADILTAPDPEIR